MRRQSARAPHECRGRALASPHATHVRCRYTGRGRDGAEVIPALEPSGMLPLGRYPATAGEIVNRYVHAPEFAASATRPEVWRHWVEATDRLRALLPVCAAWLGGSFLTGGQDPDDVDAVYLIDTREAFNLRLHDPRGSQVLAVYAMGKELRRRTGLRVDTFVLEWPLHPSPQRHALWGEQYFADRGYWDDFWQRVRTGPKGTLHVEDALPRRGYLEVILDGWHV